MVDGTGLLTIKSGALFYGYHRNKMAYVKCPVDFGEAQGVIYYSRGKPTYLQNALHGTGGAVFAQYAGGTSTGSGGTGLSWTSADQTTLSGDIFVTGKLNAVTMQSGSTLECGSAEMPEDEEMSFGATLDCADGTTMRFQAGRGLTTTAAVVAGAVTGAGTNTVTVSVAGEGSGEWLLLEAASISPKFVLDGNGGRLIRRTTDTTEQIWYTRCEGTLILFR